MKHYLLLILFLPLCGNSQTISEMHESLNASLPSFFDDSELRSYSELNLQNIEKFGIQRTACFGACPIYEFIINTDGTVKYEGYAYVDREGSFTGTISPWYFQEILELITKSKYSSFQDVYSYGITDQPTVYTMVEFKNQTKIIKNYANTGPIELWAIEELIDSLLEYVEWN